MTPTQDRFTPEAGRDDDCSTDFVDYSCLFEGGLMSLRVLIADDEALSRERLRQLLAEEPRTEVIAECSTGPEALAAIRRNSPDLVFLDVKMPELDGFGVLAALNGSPLPVVVFVTGHDRFAVQAFDVQAVDYLLKPFDRARFQRAFRRAVERLRAIVTPPSQLLTAPRSLAPPPKAERMAVKSHGRISFVNMTEIDWICAADNYVVLHVAKATHFLRSTLKELEAQLPSGSFLRINRSHLVNLERIKEIRSKSHGDGLVLLHDGTALPASRKYRRKLRPLLANFR